MKIMAREKSTRRLSPSVRVALSRMPSSRFHSASLAFSISSNSTKLSFIFSVWYWLQHFLAQQRMGFAMPQVSGRRADQFGDLVAVLELRAIDLDHRARISHQAFRGGFHHARLARTGGPEKKEIADGPARAGHARQERLIDIHYLIDGFVLPDNAPPQVHLKFHRFSSRKRRVKLLVHPAHGSTSFQPSCEVHFDRARARRVPIIWRAVFPTTSGVLKALFPLG